jgi:hypothetical protein
LDLAAAAVAEFSDIIHIAQAFVQSEVLRRRTLSEEMVTGCHRYTKKLQKLRNEAKLHRYGERERER